jgi:superfamily II DNA or RNA helicase
MTEVEIHWFSGSLLVVGSFPELEKKLTYVKKSLDWNKDKRRRETKRTTEQLYTVVSPGPERRTIQTMQGFKNDVLTICAKNEKQLRFFDHRRKMKKPVLTMAHGFRLNQKELFEQLFAPGESGLLKAPTRYGKTIMMVNAIRVYPKVRTVLAAPGVDLLTQLVKQLKEMLPNREVKGIFTGSRNSVPSNDITVCSFDSLQKINPEDVHLLLIDEPHASVSESRAPLLARFNNARIYGFGATLEGRYDGADKLIKGLIGPIHAARTFQEAVEEGAVCPIKVFFVKVQFESFVCSNRDSAYRKLVWKNPYLFNLVSEITKHRIPKDWQTLLFIDQKKQGDLLSEFVHDSEVVIASRMNAKERKQMFSEMAEGNIKRCIATNVYAQGVTFPDLRVMVNTSGGGGSISSIQKPGRLAQVIPGKTKGYLIDFMFECISDPRDNPQNMVNPSNIMWTQVVSDCNARLRTYTKMGYDVEVIESVNELNLE